MRKKFQLALMCSSCSLRDLNAVFEEQCRSAIATAKPQPFPNFSHFRQCHNMALHVPLTSVKFYTHPHNVVFVITRSVRDSVSQIKCGEADDQAVVDQAHDIAQQVSTALQQHSRACSVISLFLLSVATEVRATINQSLVPQWNHVQDNDPHMESHPFFTKTVGYVPLKQMSIPPIDSLPHASHAHNLVVPGTMPNKGKRSDHGTCRSREDSPDAESGRKKQKVLKCLSKAIISDTEDKDRQPTGTIVVMRSRIPESSGAAPTTSKGMTKNMKQPDAEPKISQPQPRGKGKEKAVDIAEPIRGHQLLKSNAEEYTPPCKRCIRESCLVVVSRKGQAIKSCVKCHFMKVRCNRPMLVDTRGPATTQKAPKSRPQSKAAPASKSKAQSRTTKTTSHIRPPTPILESEDAIEDTEVSVTGHNDAEMDHDTDTERHTDIAMEMSVEPDDPIIVDQPGAMASADDFPADHWLENTDMPIPIPIPPPTPAADLISLPSAPSSLTILEHVLALTTQVTAMQMANENALARVNAMEQEFDTWISSMHAELSSMQLDVGATVTLVNGLVGLVEKLWQEQVLANPSFLPPMISHGNDTSATTFSTRYLNGVFSPSVAPIPISVGVGQTLVSCPSGRPDMQGSVFTSGLASLALAHAGPS
ncbi:uncharacterized protein F5147DRAFT_656158 [Suillus discolor]|uniref:Uncharacterized protein n=1 Tax=Suillus discolor TaxID=1912936 RepID=A0A9P7JPX0_9AGAM|nr:uncharacterized protein F5147DRAFT_656158 [Suillus discolor]KAG2098279.1 hypothetical protein F5147DRAFT_656158 [Suillus discolor]